MLEDFMKTDEFHERWKFAARKYIVDLEWRRRKLALRIKDEEKRVTEEEKQELAERKREHKERREWESEDRREKRVGGWREFMKDNKVKKAKFSVPLKTEVKEKDKKAFALEKERIQRPDEVTRAFK
jgi:DnaJ family protein C protein 8